jgi:2-oxoglutarate dehydrogenase E2 component (dihydrolipoamide succinyltransferase)
VSELIVPSLNSTDESYVLVEWLAPDGAAITAGDPVAAIETSKAVTEIAAPGGGILAVRLPVGGTCRPGQVIGLLAAPGDHASAAPGAGVQELVAGAGVVITRKAEELMSRHGLTPADVLRPGRKVIREADVAEILDRAEVSPAGDVAVPLPPLQTAVARAVSRSHATIPAAFTVCKVRADNLLARQHGAVSAEPGFVGVPELVVQAVAAAAPSFPVFLAAVNEDLSYRPAQAVDIGITIDVGTGLYVPVIRDAGRLSLAGIARELMRLRVRALRGQVSENDLAPAGLTLALHNVAPVVLAQGIIYPGQACTISMAALDQELRLNAAGQVVSSSYFHLGISYDHRIVNGREAAAFGSAICDLLQLPPDVQLAGPDS